MRTIETLSFSRYEVKKSIFLSYATPMSEFETLRESLRAQHPKAAHVVWAYRYLNEFHQVVENSSDDGEPKGTSAQPTLGVLRGLELVNAAVVTVRYFGGIKLGTGGLVRAYDSAAKAALSEACLITYRQKSEFIFSSKYSPIQRIEYFLNKLDVLFEDRSFEPEEVIWRVKVTDEQKQKLSAFLENLV